MMANVEFRRYRLIDMRRQFNSTADPRSQSPGYPGSFYG